ncbi:MAG: hypothetical protein ABL901_01155 [Hyphomicrobiaceae bacterium]
MTVSTIPDDIVVEECSPGLYVASSASHPGITVHGRTMTEIGERWLVAAGATKAVQETRKPRGGLAVMADTMTAKQIDAEADPVKRLHLKLGYFPTPPWATRALLEHVIPDASGMAWEPACGAGHMAAVLRERFATVFASDVHVYGGEAGMEIGSFTGTGLDVVRTPPGGVDWIITNPPFTLALEFVERAMAEARQGVAVLVRTAWLEGVDRYERVFRDTPPAIVAPFVERVPMTLGRWDPAADTATAYAWIVWKRQRQWKFDDRGNRTQSDWDTKTRMQWIPPGCRDRLTKPDDAARFAGGGDGDGGMFGEKVA